MGTLSIPRSGVKPRLVCVGWYAVESWPPRYHSLERRFGEDRIVTEVNCSSDDSLGL